MSDDAVFVFVLGVFGVMFFCAGVARVVAKLTERERSARDEANALIERARREHVS